jgi:uncharacterized RDD family membrane protein YckC
MPHRAGFVIRFVATLIDGAALLVLGIASSVAMQAVWRSTADFTRASAVANAILYGVWLLYSLTEIFFAGTPGKWATGLRIRTFDGLWADKWRLLLRWQTKQLPMLCGALSALVAFAGLQLLGGLSNMIILTGCLFAMNEDHLTWHDQWAGTSVCRDHGVVTLPRMRPVAM